MSDKYEWLTLTVADYGYPMEIRNGSFYNEKGEDIAGIPADMYLNHQWWDGDSGIAVTGDQYREVPSSMKIKWFSYAEDKFYKGDFKLDHEKISALFKEGLKCNDGAKNYNYIKLAIAPGGQVFLYLVGGNTVLIGSFLAKEIFILNFKEEMGYTVDESRSQFLVDFTAKMPLQTQKEIAEKKINTTIWNDINKKYPWKYTLEALEFEHLPLTMQDDKKGANYISGEKAWCTNTDYFTKTEWKPVPTEIDGVFKTSAGRTFTIRIYPGNVDGKEPNKQTYEVQRAREQELVKLFRDFYEKTGKQDFEIHLRMDDHFKNGKVFLRKGTLEQEIPNTEVEIFDNTFGDD
ncbi:DUF2931 family protein [Kaistella jeonii]|uniref:DUF2931 family protein n=1 Tax=Kaistella jeonii TaxID=266749 RepID=A0A0C1CVX0_9FLAO|nr:DUF2931 family protein [Kaistella jeonii]KIA85465.1 hypothetical protein OA86_14540 [Kaistella jeonii]